MSRRTDSQFWSDNRRKESIPASLRAGLEYWRYHSPWHEDFGQREEVFSAASYQYILYGMGFPSESACWLSSDTERNLALESMNEAARHAKAFAAILPTNRDLLTRVRKYGLQKI
jgi:tryptophan 7-halogenase